MSEEFIPPLAEEALVRIRGVQKSFGLKEVLKGVDLDVRKKETLVIIGRSGCGKSVLLKHIIGLLRPDVGQVLFKGTDIAKLPEEGMSDIRKRFGYLFQGAALFDSMSVEDNVAFMLRRFTNTASEKIREIVSKKLELVGLDNVEDLRPASLSGGMKKRVGLARAIAIDPELILYDEPTTGLDPIMADAINDLIISLQKKLDTTSIVVTHDMVSAYKIADRMAMLYRGKIIATGTPKEIQQSSNAVVQQFINGQSQGPISILDES